MQYGYKDWVPSQSYYAFAIQAGCAPTTAYGGMNTTVFDCLVSKDTKTLQDASFNISASGLFGTWGFLPTTDGTFVQQLPSQQLLQKQVNGLNMLVGVSPSLLLSLYPQSANLTKFFSRITPTKALSSSHKQSIQKQPSYPSSNAPFLSSLTMTSPRYSSSTPRQTQLTTPTQPYSPLRATAVQPQ